MKPTKREIDTAERLRWAHLGNDVTDWPFKSWNPQTQADWLRVARYHLSEIKKAKGKR